MEKDSTQLSKIKAQLLDMGYSGEVIQLALNKARNYDIEHICELLVTHQDHFESLVKQKQNLQEDFANKNEEENNTRNSKKKGRKEKARKVKENQERRQPLTEVENNLQENYNDKSQGELIEIKKKDQTKENEMDDISIKFIESVLQVFPRLKSKDPNWLILELSDQLKSLKFKTTEGATRVMKFLETEENFPKLIELKKMVYQTLVKIFDMRVHKKLRVHMKELEGAMSNAFELKLLNTRQMKAVLACYPKFCAKIMEKPNEDLLAKLNKIYVEKGGAQEQNIIEEIKEEEVDSVENEQNEPDPLNIHAKDNELCIICLNRVREIVFLPCSHFLACPLCSPRVSKCPICNNWVKKCLKVYWS